MQSDVDEGGGWEEEETALVEIKRLRVEAGAGEKF